MELGSFHISLSETELNETVRRIQPQFPALQKLNLELTENRFILSGQIKKLVSIPFRVSFYPFFRNSVLIFQIGEKANPGKITKAVMHLLLDKLLRKLNSRLIKHSETQITVDVNDMLAELHMNSNCTIQRFELQNKTLYLELDGEVYVNFQTLLTP